MNEPESILVIRRDNIGDLICTTPLIAALRTRFPHSRMGVLANSYNAPVLEGNSDIDDVHVYRKLKHLGHHESSFKALRERIAMLWALRRRGIDLVVVAAGPKDVSGARFARMLSPNQILFSEIAVPGQHEVERIFTAARKVGISAQIPPVRVAPDSSEVDATRRHLARCGVDLNGRMVGLHISARRSSQRWPAERFAALAIAVCERLGATAILFWSPGQQNDPLHPGDDSKAKAIQDLVAGKAKLIPWRTAKLRELIAGLAVCDAVVCSDGGAMHVAAGLGKPIACFFGDSDVARWRPWGVPQVVIKAESGRVEDIELQEAVDATRELFD